jgi:hypothetical protein
MTLDFLRWFTLVVLVISLVLRLTSLARAKARGERPSEETDPDDDETYDGSRRETWTMIRYLLAGVVAEACLISDQHMLPDGLSWRPPPSQSAQTSAGGSGPMPDGTAVVLRPNRPDDQPPRLIVLQR